MNNWLEYAVPLAAVALSYICGHFQSGSTMKSDALRLRYDNFYVPFITKLYIGALWKLRYSSFVKNTDDPFFDLIFHNISYIDEKTQALLPDYYIYFFQHIAFVNGDLQYANASENLDRLFYKITKSVLVQSKAISKSLRLPDIGKAAAENLNKSPYSKL